MHTAPDEMKSKLELLAPGVHAASGFASNARNAAERAVNLALQAARNGTFGVGGFLVDRSGNILAEAVNSVIHSGFVLDPTAHVERQLVDWYFLAREHGLDLPANELTIVSSVDPCAMCTGAVLRSGMKVIALAQDEMSGVHGDAMPHRIPNDLWRQAEEQISLFSVKGHRSRLNGRHPTIFEDEVPLELLKSAERIFEQSLANAQRLIYGRPSVPNQIPKQKLEFVADAIRQQSTLYDQRFIVPTSIMNVGRTECRQRLADLLLDDACAISDADGYVIIAVPSAEELSPARTSVLELVRVYTALRRDLFRLFEIDLPHARDCFVLKSEPDREAAKLVLEVGALGSFLEGPRSNEQMPFFEFMQNTGVERLRKLIHALPPLYSEVIKLNVGSIAAA